MTSKSHEERAEGAITRDALKAWIGPAVLVGGFVAGYAVMQERVASGAKERERIERRQDAMEPKIDQIARDVAAIKAILEKR